MISALMAESEGAFCRALLLTKCLPVQTGRDFASTRRFVKEFFVKQESIAAVTALFTSSQFSFGEFALVPNMDLLSLFSQSDEAFERSML